MKVGLSVLVSNLSGSSADVVAASWKGVQYARRRVIPANPNTASQQEVRQRFARMPLWWRSIPANLAKLLRQATVGMPATAFNVIAGNSLRSLPLEGVPTLWQGLGTLRTPAIKAHAALVPKKIKIDWSAAGYPPQTYIAPLSIPENPTMGGTEEPDIITIHTPVIATQETATITMTHPIKPYYVGIFVIDAATIDQATAFSDLDVRVLQSGAAS